MKIEDENNNNNEKQELFKTDFNSSFNAICFVWINF